MESNKCAKYIASLISLGLVSKEYPYGEQKSKRSIYRLDDQMFRFWYRFVFPNMSAVVAGLGEPVYAELVDDLLNAYMGPVFEDICKQWFFVQARKYAVDNNQRDEHAPPFFIGSIGRWWGTNTKTRSQEELDIMSVNKNAALFAECKWSNANVDIDVFHNLKRKSEMFNYADVHLYIFTKTGCTPRLNERRSAGEVKLYSLETIIRTGVDARIARP